MANHSADAAMDVTTPSEFSGSSFESESTDTEASVAKAPLVAPTDGRDSAPSWNAKLMMWVSLVALTAQTTGQVMLVKWARNASGGLYLNSTLVLFIEIVKTIVSLILVFSTSGSCQEAVASLREHFCEHPVELLKTAVPAVIYTLQTNLNLYSLEKLSAAVQQVLYQMKILTTAGLSTLMLGKVLGITKWTACFMLAGGIMMVEWPRGDEDEASGSSGLSDRMLGFLAVFTTSITSGFNAVYIEKLLKNSTASIWIRNVQLGLFGSIVALFVVFIVDGAKVRQNGGVLQGYWYGAWMVVFMSALGGLLCAVMLKYAGATLGCFSTALSIILTCFLSWFLMKDIQIDGLFLFGTAFAISASLLYGLGFPLCLTSRILPASLMPRM